MVSSSSSVDRATAPAFIDDITYKFMTCSVCHSLPSSMSPSRVKAVSTLKKFLRHGTSTPPKPLPPLPTTPSAPIECLPTHIIRRIACQLDALDTLHWGLCVSPRHAIVLLGRCWPMHAQSGLTPHTVSNTPYTARPGAVLQGGVEDK